MGFQRMIIYMYKLYVENDVNINMSRKCTFILNEK